MTSAASSAASRRSLLAPGSGFVVAERYRLGRKLGSGSFGHVYLGIDLAPEDDEDLVAVKVESRKVQGALLAVEAEHYKRLEGSDYNQSSFERSQNIQV